MLFASRARFNWCWKSLGSFLFEISESLDHYNYSFSIGLFNYKIPKCNVAE